MSDTPTKAVFLSYASQDAEAARRICESLRSGGVEVWFDADGGLEHGDEWDAKIRRQIKECVLFIPVLSASTQAREEGYFRLEWDLAAERARTIASGVPFILPVVIDDTREPDALVPDRFRMVQWTKLRGGEVPPEVQQRFLKLWSHRTGALKHEVAQASLPAISSDAGGTPALPKAARSIPAVAWIAATVAVATLVAFIALRPKPNASDGTPPPTTAKVAAMSPELAAIRARIIPDRWEKGDYDILRAALDRVIQATPDEADAYALRSIIASLQVIRSFDYGTKMLVAGKADAERALRTTPDSPLGELALGLHHVAMMARGGNPQAARQHIARAVTGLTRDSLIRYVELVDSNWALRFDEFQERCAKWLAEEPSATYPRSVLGQNFLARRQAADAEKWAQEGAQEGTGVTSFRSQLALFEINFFLRADVSAARAAIDRLPSAALSSHRVVHGRWLLALAERNWDNAIRELAQIPDTILYDRSFHGPKALLTGIAHVKASRATPAAAAFAEAERVLRALLANDADNEQLRAALALTLAYAGRAAEARNELAAIEPLLRGRSPYFYSAHVHSLVAETYAVLDDIPGMLPWLQLLFGGVSSVPYTPASFRLDPRFERVIGDPRVEAFLKEFSPAEPSKSLTYTTVIDPKSVAVLPFANQSDDKANEYFSDGIADELLTVLQKIPGLRVAARTSAWSFKGKNPTAQEVGEKLGMAHVVEGSVQKIGNRVKITARLSRAATNEEVWSKSFSPLELTDVDVFAIQSEIALAIVGELRGKLTGEAAIKAEVAAAERGGTKNAAAHEQYLQGQFFLNQSNPEDPARPLAFFRRAVELDDKFAQAWAGLARTYVGVGSYGRTVAAIDENFVQARRAADRALTLEPNLADGYCARMEIQCSYDFDWKGAEQSLRRALALAPANAEIILSGARLAGVFGQPEKVVEIHQQVLALDPLNLRARLALLGARVQTSMSAGKFSEAEVEINRMAELVPPLGPAMRLPNYLLQGRFPEALAEAEKIKGDWPPLYWRALAHWGQKQAAESDAALNKLIADFPEMCTFQIAAVYAYRRQPDQAFEWLERAYQHHDSGLQLIKDFPFLRNLHTDPRWPVFLRKLGLADEQLK